MRYFEKIILTIFTILFLWLYIDIYKTISYGEPVDKKAKVIEFIIDKDKGKFETVLEVNGEIIFKDDRAFYYKVRDKLNQEIDVTIKENKKNNKIVIDAVKNISN